LIKLNQQRKDLFFTLLNQLWHLISGPIIILLIPLFLSPEQQGYWYLFGSLAALRTFADLGFSNIVLQFSAHEFAFLYFLDNGQLAGEERNLKKLGSFFRFVIKWISSICIVVFPIIYVIGIVFFVRDDVLTVYLLPWTLYAIGTLINFFNNSILSFIEGFNKIELIQRIRFRVALINTVVVMTILIFGGNIYALAFGMLLSASSVFVSIFGGFRKLLIQLINISRGFIYDWRKEIFPLFIKYALSFSSGYFIFQIYTPLMHYFYGPIYSGKVGITLTLVMAIFNFSNIWMYTITPKMNMLISQKLWSNLDSLFRKRLLLSLGTYLLISMMLFLFLAIFGNFWIIPKITARFLPITSLIILLVCYFLQVFINAWALYLRGHKQEPYVVPSVVSAVSIVIITYIVGRLMSPVWFFLGFMTSYVWSMPVDYSIYKKCKRKWHEVQGIF
jgi:O-antigen/teichoic acid export membrane protein